ncbi:MAG TPA: hypothetical protein VKG79_12160 [Bryobacteraceae bacterium]|nr:hypothetical protein [Bryobacteraceae bacterium]
MRTGSRLLCLAAMSLAVVQSCRADMTVGMYLKGDRVINGVYLNGVGQGFSWANYWMKQQGRPPIYCEPDSVALDGSDYVKMVDRQIERLRRTASEPDFKGMLVAALLLKTLVEAFPCQSTK